MVVDVSETQKGNAHGNGDQAIVEDFIAVLARQTTIGLLYHFK